jgi:hypothetical protein
MLSLASAALVAGLVLINPPLRVQDAPPAGPLPSADLPLGTAPPTQPPATMPAPSGEAPPPVTVPPAPAEAAPSFPPRAAAPAPSTSGPSTSGQSTLSPSLPAPDDGRYNIHRMQDDLIRLDTRTGQVSVCRNNSAGWACQAVPDERAALDSEIARLQAENAAVKKELLAHGLSLPRGVRADPPPPPAAPPPAPPQASPTPEPVPGLKVPTDADLDRMMAFMEKVWRRLVEMMANVQRDMKKS